jgi:hypothetical protein
MRRIWLSRCGLGILCLCVLVSVLAIGAEVSVKDLTANPAQFDGKTVALQGIATAVKATSSKKGNDYTIFQVKDAVGRSVKVFSWGHPEIKDGTSVEVVGVFQQVRRVGRYTFYNEIEAQSVRPLTR